MYIFQGVSRLDPRKVWRLNCSSFDFYEHIQRRLNTNIHYSTCVQRFNISVVLPCTCETIDDIFLNFLFWYGDNKSLISLVIDNLFFSSVCWGTNRGQHSSFNLRSKDWHFRCSSVYVQDYWWHIFKFTFFDMAIISTICSFPLFVDNRVLILWFISNLQFSYSIRVRAF